MTTRDRDYQMMMNALADVSRRRDDELAGADQAYQDNSARAAGELARAENEAQSADRWAGAAAAQVLEVDREAARLWDQLRRARGMRVRAMGELPEPAAVESMPRVALQRRSVDDDEDSPRAMLARTAERIDDTVRPARRRSLPRWTLPFLPFLGAVVAGATALIAAGLVTMGSEDVAGGTLIRGLGWLCFLVAPSAGVPVAAVFAHRRWQARLDIGGIGLTLLGGMIAAAMLSLTFAASR